MIRIGIGLLSQPHHVKLSITQQLRAVFYILKKRLLNEFFRHEQHS